MQGQEPGFQPRGMESACKESAQGARQTGPLRWQRKATGEPERGDAQVAPGSSAGTGV